MAFYYKVGDSETAAVPLSENIQAYEENAKDCSGPCIKYDFTNHVLIELLDNVTPETKLWVELGLARDKNITHKRLLLDPHRVNCRRAIVVCSCPDKAKQLAQRLSQVKIFKRSICAVVIQELLSDICLFEKQIIQYGDKRSQHQLVYVTELSRRREPSGLAQYLREKFSPFGTILSVLVSEDKDGYAYPEGVIKFAHLSEAFAAELAYDQCAVALERLSVTTHHNILLSQCDLRARLREAYSKQSSEFSFNVVSPGSVGKSKEAELDETKNFFNNGCVKEPDKSNQPVENKSGNILNSNNEFRSDSAELADVLKKPCESNLVDCLQGIVACSESSISKRASGDSLSFTESEQESVGQLLHSVNQDNSSSTHVNKTLSSRIMGWITDLPTSQVDMTLPAENDVPLLESSNLTDAKTRQLKAPNSTDVLSNSGSFVTCNNGDLNSSFNSCPSSPIHAMDSNITMVEDKTFFYSSECYPGDTTEEETSNCDSSVLESSVPNVLSLKRKNSSMMTQKLSLKSKRLNSQSEFSDGDTTVHLPSVPKVLSCSVLLKSVPGLDEIAKNMSTKKIPVVKKLNFPQPVGGNLKGDSINILDVSESEDKNKIYPNVACNSRPSSVKSQPIRRSTRLSSRSSDTKSNSFSNSSLKNVKKPSTSSDSLVGRKANVLNEIESPLRMWLRKELDASANNQVTRKESTKSIVCATTNKDVLISVGCSHMTCDFCYPDSTKLLLGFH